MEVSGVGLNCAQPLQKRLQHQLILTPAVIIKPFFGVSLAVFRPIGFSLGPLLRRHIPDVDFIEVIIEPFGQCFSK